MIDSSVRPLPPVMDGVLTLARTLRRRRPPLPVHHAGSSTPKPACSSSHAVSVKNVCAPPASVLYPPGAAVFRLASTGGQMAAAWPRVVNRYSRASKDLFLKTAVRE